MAMCAGTQSPPHPVPALSRCSSRRTRVSLMRNTVDNSPVLLRSPRLLIREIEYGDIEQMQSWRPFSEPLHRLWNIPRRPSLSREVWFMLNSSDPTRLWYAVERSADRQLLGSITLREIVVGRSARLGISFGADYVDQGYGSEALRLFLAYYFDELDFPYLYLDVAAANKRARHVYEKLGFRYVGRHYRDIPDRENLLFLREEQYCHLREYFRPHRGRWQLLFFDMVLECSDWHQQDTALHPSPNLPRQA
jgi:diamine N-acetyltransferase